MTLFPDDLVNTRKIIERIDDLEMENSDDDGEMTHVDQWEESARKEYRGLAAVVHEVGEKACRDGVALVNERYFTAHIKDEYLEIGPEYYEDETDDRGRPTYRKRHVQNGELFARSPFKFIDWEAVAQDEWSDYSQLEVDGVTYLYLEP